MYAVHGRLQSQRWWYRLEVDVVHDGSQRLGTLLHFGKLCFTQLLTDKMCDALLAKADWDAQENLIRDAVPAFRQRA